MIRLPCDSCPSYLINNICELTKNALNVHQNSPNPYGRRDHIYNKKPLWAQDQHNLDNKDGHMFHKYSIAFPAKKLKHHQICKEKQIKNAATCLQNKGPSNHLGNSHSCMRTFHALNLHILDITLMKSCSSQGNL